MESTDLYNPKVIAASKGSFTRIEVFYTDLADYLIRHAGGKMIAGAFLGGESLYKFRFPVEGGFIVMGNESNGVGERVASLVTNKITIPRVGTAESLNVGIATAVMLDNLRRQSVS